MCHYPCKIIITCFYPNCSCCVAMLGAKIEDGRFLCVEFWSFCLMFWVGILGYQSGSAIYNSINKVLGGTGCFWWIIKSLEIINLARGGIDDRLFLKIGQTCVVFKNHCSKSNFYLHLIRGKEIRSCIF